MFDGQDEYKKKENDQIIKRTKREERKRNIEQRKNKTKELKKKPGVVCRYRPRHFKRLIEISVCNRVYARMDDFFLCDGRH